MTDTATEAPLLKHTEVLRQRLSLEGARIADVGCGNGSLVRVMARSGAWVLGIDPGPQQLARAKAAEVAGGPENREVYVCALGEALPLPDGCLDALVYFNALHHVPVPQQGAALAEAVRVLRPGGLLYVQEPVADGDYFQVVRPIEDETEVRDRAYDALKSAAAAPELEEVEEFFYRAPFREKSFEAFRDNMISIDPRRRATVEAQEESLRQAFLAAGEQRDGAFWFEIPSRLNLLRRT